MVDSKMCCSANFVTLDRRGPCPVIPAGASSTMIVLNLGAMNWTNARQMLLT